MLKSAFNRVEQIGHRVGPIVYKSQETARLICHVKQS